MDDNHFLDSDMLNVQKERPTFLTVLTIITFIVSGIWLLQSVFSFFTFNEEASIIAVENVVVQYSEMGMEESMINATELFGNETIENNTLFSLLTILSCLLSLAGAYMMYNMKKIGFHLYLSSKIIGLIPLTIYSTSVIVVGFYGFVGVVALAFIIMYAVNLKHLRN